MSSEPNVWLDATVQTLRDNVSMFEAKELELVSISEALPDKTSGAYIALVGKEQSIELGFVCTPAGHQALAQKFLGAEEELPQDDVIDAMREVANILVGALKSAMIQHDPSLALGLPMFVDGVHVGANTRTHVAHVRLNAEDVWLIVIARG